jgi:splicing factor 3B subunit 3
LHAVSFLKKIKNGFIINKKNIIELYTVSKLGEIQLIQSTFLFGDLRDFDILLLPMNVIDYITCTSSSGTFIILKFCVNKKWKILLKHFFSRSGLRRNIPGYYLKNDYLGRISIISAVEKIRYIYIYSNIKYSKKIICSPIEVHKTNTLITDIQALENYYENPFFASLEIDLAEAHKNLTCTRDNVEFQIYDLKKKYIVFYEFDIGLNILITSFLDKITHNTHIIIPVRDIYHSKPYCMICDGTFIILKNKIFDDIYCRFPSKVGNPKNFRKSIILYLISRLNRRHFYFVQVNNLIFRMT